MISVHRTRAGATFAVKVHPHAKKNATDSATRSICRSLRLRQKVVPTRPVSNSWQIF
jgi:hypothetical protein